VTAYRVGNVPGGRVAGALLPGTSPGLLVRRRQVVVFHR
jgi:hypothetical protein